MPFRLLIASTVLVSLVSCASDDDPAAPSTVTGVVIEVSSEGLGRVQSLVVKDGDTTYDILIDPKVDYEFSLDHLHEHRATGDPVVVRIDERNGDLYARSIKDA